MTMSRMTVPAFLLAIASVPSAAQVVSAEQAIETHRRSFQPVELLDCPPSVGEEIVVCAKRSARSERLPLPIEPVAGERIAGEMPRATSAAEPSCSAVGRDNGCGGTIPILGAILLLAKVAQKVIEPE